MIYQVRFNSINYIGIDPGVSDGFVNKLIDQYRLKDTDLTEPLPVLEFNKTTDLSPMPVTKPKYELGKECLKVEQNIVNYYEKKALNGILKDNEITRNIKQAKARQTKRHLIKIQNKMKRRHFNKVSF